MALLGALYERRNEDTTHLRLHSLNLATNPADSSSTCIRSDQRISAERRGPLFEFKLYSAAARTYLLSCWFYCRISPKSAASLAQTFAASTGGRRLRLEARALRPPLARGIRAQSQLRLEREEERRRSIIAHEKNAIAIETTADSRR